MTIRQIMTAIFALALALPSMALEYGLRFKSHTVAESERTALRLSDTPFPFSSEISVSFEMDFYDADQFGHICSLIGDDGSIISFVSASENGTFHPGIVVNDKLNIVPLTFSTTGEKPMHLSLTLQKKENRVLLVINGQRFLYPANLKKMGAVKVEFGWSKPLPSVAPVEIQDIAIYIDKRNTHKWELRKHQGDSVIDELSGTVATAISPHWIVDDHVAWRSIFELKTKDLIQTAFNPQNETFYIASPSKVILYNAKENTSSSVPVTADGRVMKYSNYLAYDNLTDQLLSYNISKKQTSRFNFATRQWSTLPGNDEEPYHANHGYTRNGKLIYMFGGYGFYMYHNNLIRLDLETDQMENLMLQPVPQPRTSASMCVVGDKLFLFGGMGNQVGKQEIPTENYYDLWEYDLNTLKGRKVWDMDTISRQFLPSSSMYYIEKDSCFYFASTLHGGCMMRISRNYPSCEVVSEPIHSKMDYRDCVFDLYRSADEKNYYLVMDKRIDKTTHDYHIYRISYPFRNILMIDIDSAADNKSSGLPVWAFALIIGGCIIVGGGVIYLVLRKGRNKKSPAVSNVAADSPSISAAAPAPAPAPSPAPASAPATAPASAPAPATAPASSPSSASDNSSNEALTPSEAIIKEEADKGAENSIFPTHPENASKSSIFKHKASTISLLGKFEVKDKEGNDISPRFTSRIQSLLIMLLLYSAKNEKGISFEVLDEEIWGDKDEKSAKNNRNVYMRRLRVLLEEVGNMEISYDKGYYRIDSSDVFIDYIEVMTRLASLSKPGEDMSPETVDETVELLLRGTLLPNVSFGWLDKFKASYTEASLTLLNRVLEKTFNSDDAAAYRIAETISLHDPFSEEALAVKIKILCKRRMKGPARTVYDNFCKEYEKSLGEPYPVAFSQIVQNAD